MKCSVLHFTVWGIKCKLNFPILQQKPQKSVIVFILNVFTTIKGVKLAEKERRKDIQIGKKS